jgi:hypothetical protein
MLQVVAPMLLGLAFGWLLNKAGLTHYARIVNIYRLRDATVLRFMLSALFVAALGIQVSLDLGLCASVPIPPTAALANLVGGLVFGVGMASAGYCPGTIVAEAGEGRLDAWLAGLVGLLFGAVTFGLLQPLLMPGLMRVGNLGRVTLAGLAGASPWLVLLVFGQAVLLLFVLLDRRA